jgi:peptidoglycan/xylan/chitin deacetylase (PgdA/CDA1 family)
MATTGAYRLALRGRVTVLAFHRIGCRRGSSGIDYSVERFDRLCEFLAKNVRVTSLRQQLQGLEQQQDRGGTVSLTFDDGYLDNFTIAAPVLEKYGLTATFFITTGFIDSRTVPRWDQGLPRHPGWMTWSQIESLSKRGFDIGCHTKSHADLGSVSSEEAQRELHDSRVELQDRLGIAADLFAYPFGGPDNMSQENLALVRQAGFKCCLSCHGGVNRDDADLFHLNRVPINDWYATPQQLGFELMTSTMPPKAAHKPD